MIWVTKGGTNKPVVIANIYRHPKDIIDKYRKFTQEHRPVLKSLENMNVEAIEANDYNIDLLKINEREVFSEMFWRFDVKQFLPKNNTSN